MIIKYFRALFLCFCVFVSCAAFAQQEIPRNLSNVHISELSDDQIRQLMQQAGSSGLSDNELLQMAKDRGLPNSELAELQTRVRTIRGRDGLASDTSLTDTAYSRQYKGNDNLNRADTLKDTRRSREYRKDVFSSILPAVFGADIFRNSSTTFSPNLKLATPRNYVVGPEDQLNVNVYGNSVANWKLTVSPEGNINLPVAGSLNVAGKTIDDVTAEIKKRLLAYHFAIGNGTNVQVTLGNIRSINVLLVGYVQKPGSYTLSSLSTAFNALYAAGGPSDKGSFRQIEIIRNNKVIRLLDIYDFLVKGDQRSNISLRDQDEIRIPPYQTHVEMAGEVKTPAIFEVLPGETLDDVLRFAGGFTDQAYTSRIKVYQVSERQRRINDVEEGQFKNYVPKKGDKYIVQRILERFENRVVITGAVFFPGDYQLEPGLSVSSLVGKAGGLREDAFTEHGNILRLNADNSKRILSFNIGDILDKKSPDILLQREDSVYISSIFQLRDKYTVTIKGDVRKPGTFTYPDSMRISDLIIKAGGFLEGATAKRVEVSRRNSDTSHTTLTGQAVKVYSVDIDPKLNSGNPDFILRPFDIVSVYSLPDYEKQRTVRIVGEVMYPGYYSLKTQDEKISDVIRRAGYLKPLADAAGSSLKRTNTVILGVDKGKKDSVALSNERADRLRHLQQTLRDSSTIIEEQARNNFIGIDLTEILKKPGSVTDLILEDGDEIRVPKQQQVVKVNGEVLYPSAVVFTNDRGFKDYVLAAGGFSPHALRKGAYIVYANGSVKGTRKFLFFNSYPEVKPGGEIYVPRKPPANLGNAQFAIGLTTGLASLGAIILGIISLHK